MRRLQYASGYVLTGDRTCKAVLRYARALADAGKADVVSVPVVTEGGSYGYAHMLIGPASQIFSTPVEHAAAEPEDAEIIEELEKLTIRIQPSRPEWPQEMTDVPTLDDLDIDYNFT
ncbi:MAG: hypothetical protein JWQ59_2016 [Cryobacterium sp.]|jgi:hypothetical protein|nr:hypothetical protein [Cryobacterium sp.]